MSTLKAMLSPIGGVALVAVVAVALSSCGESSASSAGNGKPAVVLTPSPSPSFHNGQLIGVSVGANKYFARYSRIEVLECADPGGTTANLPTNDFHCDGNTTPGFSILVHKDGSFSTRRYRLYSLPNAVLGEPPDNQPVCNATHQCVLYVGQDQTNFTAPKVFSAPFTITSTGSSGSATG